MRECFKSLKRKICIQAVLNLFGTSFLYKNPTINYKSASSGFKEVYRDLSWERVSMCRIH